MPLPSFLQRFRPGAHSRVHQAPPLSPADIEAARVRARRRMIGMAVLVGAGVIGFPWLFETQPRPLASDIAVVNASAPPVVAGNASVTAGTQPSSPRSNGLPAAVVNASDAAAAAAAAESARVEAGGQREAAPSDESIADARTAMGRETSARDNAANRDTEEVIETDERASGAGASARDSITARTVAKVAAAEDEHQAKAEAKARQEAKLKAQAEAKAHQEAKARADAKLKAEAKAKADARLKAEAQAKAASEARQKAQAKAKADATVVTKADPKHAASKPGLKPDAKPSPKPEVKPTPAAAAASADTRYIVQVGAFGDATTAHEARMKVERLGIKTYTHEIGAGTTKKIRVRVGPYATKAEADRAMNTLRKGGLSGALLTL